MKFLILCILTIAVNVAISQDVGSERRRRTLGRSERAKKLKYFLKKHGRLEGMIRLVDGTKPSEGNLEIFHLNRWGSICDDEYDKTDADVACRELGFPGAITATHNGFFGPAKHKFWIDNLFCSGAEKNITECRHDGWGTHDCEDTEVAGVKCKEDPVPVQIQPDIPPVVGVPLDDILQKDKAPKRSLFDVFGKKVKVRLTGGRITEEGRVEVQLGTKDWGVICGDGWSIFEAMVICRQLGYGYAQDAMPTDFFGGNHSDIVLSGLSCRGTEKNLRECMHEVDDTSCPGRQGNVAALTCVPEQADLIPDHYEIMRSAHLEDRQLFFLQCAMEENCVSSSAYHLQKEDANWHLETRRLLRFTARITNIGTADFRPYIPRHLWEWHACHMHYHSMEVFAHFDVLDSTGRRIAEGHKASFCLEDNACNPGVTPRYKCANYGEQGISVGCTDTYAYNIDCQWIDITDIDPGMYTFRVVINPDFKVAEQTFENNAAVCNLYYGPTFATVYNCTLTRP